MKNYIGTKIVKADLMVKGVAETVLERVIAFKGPLDSPGYLVSYEDGYASWSPKEAFEKAYRQFRSDKNTVTQADVDGFIAKIEVSTIKDNTTLVVVTLINGFIITESSACVDPANYDEKYGTEICMEKIKDKIWFLLGFLLQCGMNGLNGGK